MSPVSHPAITLQSPNVAYRANLDSIQALLMTSFVLLNDMKAEASWALLGLTCRLAQSLGLDREQALDSQSSLEVRRKETVRRKLWYVAWIWDTGFELTICTGTGGLASGTMPLPHYPLTGE